MKKGISISVVILILIFSGFICIRYYPYVFAKTVEGVITGVERVNAPQTMIVTGAESKAIEKEQIFSFAISIKDASGEIHTASSEDRQWAVAQIGQCVESKFFPHPFWNLEKSGTYFGARLIRLYVCPTESTVPNK